MSKTFDQSLIDTAKISMSMLDIDDISDTSSEEFESLRREQQGCHNELTHREEFPFGTYTKVLRASENKSLYPLPEGQIKNVYNNGEKLIYIEKYLELDEKTGKPEFYYIIPSTEKIGLYPIPDDNYNLTLEYYDDRFVLDTDEEPQREISIGSTLRMPERVQHLYFDALEYFLLAEHIKKQTNARWQPTMKIANDRWLTFIKSTRQADSETYFVI